MLDIGDTELLERSETADQTCRITDGCKPVSDGIVMRELDDLDTVIVTKTVAGFESASTLAVTNLVRDAAEGRSDRLKFLVFDFAHPAAGREAVACGAFETLLKEVANLILRAPVISVAWARAPMSGEDLELALACSMLVAEQGTQFALGIDRTVSVATYALLVQKIGFLKAEALIEKGRPLGTEELRDLLLIKEVAPKGIGIDGIEQFVHRRTKKHNASWGIYRAQRIATPLAQLW